MIALKTRSPVSAELRDSRITSTYCLSGRLSRSSFFTSTNAGPGREQLVLVLDLVAVIRVDAVLGVDPVALGEVEQRPRRDRDDELVRERGLRHPSVDRPSLATSAARRRRDRLRLRYAARFSPSPISANTARTSSTAQSIALALDVERRREAHDGAVRVLGQDAAREQAIDDRARG